MKILVCYDINNKPVYLGSKVRLNLGIMGEGNGFVEGIVEYNDEKEDYAAFHIKYINPFYKANIMDNEEEYISLMFYPKAIEVIS